MSSGSLLETMTAIGIQALVLAGLAGLLASSAGIAATAASSADRLQAFAHVEHLVDSAAARAGTGPGATALPLRGTHSVELFADLDYDGRVDSSSKERSEIVLSFRSPEERQLALRLGRQSVAIGPAFDPSRRIAQGFVAYGESSAIVLHWFSLPAGEGDLLAVAARRTGR